MTAWPQAIMQVSAPVWLLLLAVIPGRAVAAIDVIRRRWQARDEHAAGAPRAPARANGDHGGITDAR